MNSPDSWMRLKNVAEQRRDASARTLADVVKKLQQANDKLQLLLDYRLDYQTRLDRASRLGIGGEGLRNYQSFLTNLERAVEQQTATVAELEGAVTLARRQVNADYRRTESYQVLDDRRSSAADSKDRRREQASQDEMATRTRPNLFYKTD